MSAQSLALCELLEEFPSCEPVSLGAFLALLPPLPPRYYSVGSSQLGTPHSLEIAFSVVTHRIAFDGALSNATSSGAPGASETGTSSSHISGTTRVDGDESANGTKEHLKDVNVGESETFAGVVRRGLCTNWLEGILEPLLEPEKIPPKGTKITVPVFMKPTKEFLLPASAKWPCVLIGPGTG